MEHETSLSLQYLNRLQDEIASESKNPHDRYHLGKLILKQLREHPDKIYSIDGITNEQETNGSVLKRSTAIARAITSQGLKVGDMVIFMLTNSMDSVVLLLACLYIGVLPVNLDCNMSKKDVIKDYLVNEGPKIIFCIPERAKLVEESARELGMTVTVVTIGKEEVKGFYNLKQFMTKFDNGKQSETFEAISFDTNVTPAFMFCTSGTTDISKLVVHTHRSFINSIAFWFENDKVFPGAIRMAIMMSNPYWISATMHIVYAGLFVFPMVQLTPFCSRDQFISVIEKYKPSWCFISIHMAMKWIQWIDKSNELSCNMSCFNTMIIGGNSVPNDVVYKLQSMISGKVKQMYGSSELGGIGFVFKDEAPIGSCGKPIPNIEYKLVDILTSEEVSTNKPGELWIRGACLFKEYYKNEEATTATFAPGGWYKTGDIMYKDEKDYYYFLDRIKMLMKIPTGYISPTVIENVIHQHPGVSDVAVCPYLQPGDGDYPTACIVRGEDSRVTAQEIKDLVRDKLEDRYFIRGGVVFIDKMPLTASLKVDRMKLKEIVRTVNRE